jgi:pyrroloquinoline quinone biosynthesis protein E
MREPCASCELREVDHGGCRCQAFALSGDAREADPACAKSPHHAAIVEARARAASPPPPMLYRVRSAKGA